VSFALGPAFGILLQGLHDSGLNVPIASSGANMTTAQVTQFDRVSSNDLYFNAVRGILGPEPGNGAIAKAQRRFFDTFKAAGLVPELGNTASWDAAFLVVDALRHAGARPTANAVRDYINSQRNWSGIYGNYDFVSIPQRGLDEHAVMIYRWDRTKKNFAPASKPGEL
jgi:branched-chain amino acid transport system substrate-binding protein